jgi:hypothetical protein
MAICFMLSPLSFVDAEAGARLRARLFRARIPQPANEQRRGIGLHERADDEQDAIHEPQKTRAEMLVTEIAQRGPDRGSL